jgi:hypothetical protein
MPGRKTVELFRTDKPVWLQLAVSPDENWLLWSQGDT